MKITVTGDIMCEPSIMEAAKAKDGSYDFTFVFEKAKKLWKNSDFTVGNLEFPLADGLQLTSAFDVFNAPLPYGQAAKDAGLDLVSVVNNHTLDRGLDGMKKTLDYLESIGLPATGAYAPEKGREEAYYFEKDGKKIAVIAYTYTTNCKLKAGEEDAEEFINYLRDPHSPTYLPEVQARFTTWVDKLLPKMSKKKRIKIKRALGLPKPFARKDDLVEDSCQKYLEKLAQDIKLAKEKADFVLFYPHTGGQFNTEPGLFSKRVFETALKAGADAILASHSHVLQKAEWEGSVPCAWSMSNFNMDNTSKIVVRTDHPEMGILVHLYLDAQAKLEKVTFSLTKAVWENKKYITYPVKDLAEKLSGNAKEKLCADVRHALKLVYGKDYEGELFLQEYELAK